MKNEILFTGRWFDETTGLHYYRARWYDSREGRFTGRDPIGLEITNNNDYKKRYRFETGEIGLLFNLDRFIKRMTRKTMIEKIIQFMALYKYSLNNAVNIIDPKGTDVGGIGSCAVCAACIYSYAVCPPSGLITFASCAAACAVCGDYIGEKIGNMNNTEEDKSN